ncbi:MAG: hypothetical protein WCB57_05065 [Pseudonocardiaceae bacterium]
MHPTDTGNLASDEEGDGVHVGISSERDTPSGDAACWPLPGSDSSRRGPPQSTVTHQELVQVLLGAALLFLLGMLLGATWATQALQPRLRRKAEERRRLNAEWSAVRAAQRQRGQCPRCASPLSEEDWYFVPALVQDPPDDED